MVRATEYPAYKSLGLLPAFFRYCYEGYYDVKGKIAQKGAQGAA